LASEALIYFSEEIKFYFREEFRNQLVTWPTKQKHSREFSPATQANNEQFKNFFVGVSYKLESTPVGRFCKCFEMMTVFNNRISVLQAEVIINGSKCAIFAYKQIMFGQVIKVRTITPQN